MNRNNRIEYISLASVLSAIAVIYLHANGCFWTFSTSRYWFTANILESVFYFAVPIFFMISGAMLIDFDKRYSLKEYFQKRIYKTVIPYLVWSFIGFAIELFYIKNIALSDVDLTYIVNGLLNGSLVQVYWFFIPLFCIYLCIPVFAAISDDKKKDIFIYLAIATFILNVLIPFLISVFNIPITFPLSLKVMGGNLFYTVTGYLLHKYEFPKNRRFLLYLIALIGLLLHIGGTYYLSMAAGEVVKTYKGYMGLPCVLYSVGIFVLIKYDLVKILKFDIISRIVNYLDFYTFGIYLIHWYFLKFFEITFNLNFTSIVYRLLIPIPVLIISVISIYLLRKVPLIRNIVP